MRPNTHSFEHAGHRLVYDEYGAGERVVILTPGLLFSRKMHGPLAATLARRGHRVLCLDLLGHGASDRPPQRWSYSMPIFGAQVLGLMDHLELEHAVLGGTSLGANVTLEATAAAPQRVQGMMIEMPVLDNALLGCALAFAPLLLSLTLGAPLARLGARAASAAPRRGPLLGQMLLDWASQDPGPSAAVLQGLFFGPTAPPREDRRKLTPPTLVIAHPRDPLHPFSDSEMLLEELPDARLIEASSILELRLSPERLIEQIARFVDSCFGGPGSGRGATTSRSSATAVNGSGAAASHSRSSPA